MREEKREEWRRSISVFTVCTVAATISHLLYCNSGHIDTFEQSTGCYIIPPYKSMNRHTM